MSKSLFLSELNLEEQEFIPQESLIQAQVILKPLAMTIPNEYGIYSPSKLIPQKELTHEEFLNRYADYPRELRVCFDETVLHDDLLQKSELVTAYGFGLDCWYTVERSI